MEEDEKMDGGVNKRFIRSGTDCFTCVNHLVTVSQSGPTDCFCPLTYFQLSVNFYIFWTLLWWCDFLFYFYLQRDS